MRAALLAILFAAVADHYHPPVLPAPDDIWYRCCSNRDCREAQVKVSILNERRALVAVADYPPFVTDVDKLHESQNGRSYICTQNGDLPPTAENVLCVFWVKPAMV